MIHAGLRRFCSLVIALMTLAVTNQSFAADAKSRLSHFKLDNGMEVLVIPDHRAPVVTHMVFYRVGAADEPRGQSGIAHFFEHLMFKSTKNIPSGEFSKIIARLGGQDNAFTTQDATAYFQRVAKEQLPKMMEMEAERMVNLTLSEEEVRTERDVILEERRSRIDNNPSSQFSEQMDSVLYQNHPYRIPVIGWEHEMAQLSRGEAIKFYKHYYAPNNAILVVAGDVTADEVRKLAEKTYGKLTPVDGVTENRSRPTEPPVRAPRRISMEDPRAGQPSLHRYYLVPSYPTAPKGDAEALDVLVKLLADGATSRFYRKAVVEDRLASSANGYYDSGGLDSGKVAFYAIAQDKADLPKIEAQLDELIADVIKNGVSEAELKRAKASYIADYTYESDSQATLARRYGWGLATGLTIESMENWPERIRAVTSEDVKRVAAKYLDIRASVTGTLLPKEQDAAQKSSDAPPKSRS
ncbi:MAG: insulinase family protein [Hyphomicrobiaceae bacterium]|nr:insulinase family protein [Hyphomicrobiaceae bacterium]